MAQKKKKNSALSSIDRATMIALNWDDIRADRLKDFKVSTKVIYQKLANDLGADLPIDLSEQHKEAFQRIMRTSPCKTEDVNMAYAYIIRCLTIGYWMKHKVVYRVSRETVEFIQSLHLFENMNVPFSDVFAQICKKPIYIEVQGVPNRVGMFMCSTMFSPPSSDSHIEVNDAQDPCFFCLPIENDSGYIACLKPGRIPAKEVYRDGKENKKVITFFYEIAVYIAYCLNMKDSVGSVFIPRPGKSYTHVDVKPIPYTDSLPDFTRPDGWIAAGLCHAFGFLSRDAMKDRFQADIQRMDIPRVMIYNTANNDTAIDFGEKAMAFLQKSVLDWEESKIVYQYSDEVAEVLSEKYMDDINFFGIPDELLNYMPYEASILLNQDTGSIVIASRCKVRYQDGRIYGGILFLASNIVTQTMEAAVLTGKTGQNYFFREGSVFANQLIGATDIMYHILMVMRTKSQKRITKELLSQAPPEAGILVPTRESAPHIARVRESDTPSIRIGDDIQEPSFVLNEVTVRTVKRVPQKEALERGGWKMVPHVRRRHPHRYWVGKGPERHLETRWLEPMKINDTEKKRKQAAVIHNIKT